MWTCPVCKREFKNENQSHYCTAKPKSIEEYIRMQSEEQQEDLRKIYRVLKAALPECEERIAWSMPTFWKQHNVIHFAAAAKHIGVFPGPEAVSVFAEELKKYHPSKGTIRVPYGKVDEELLERIARWCLETGNHP